MVEGWPAPGMRREPSGKWKSTLEVSEEGLEIAKDDREGTGRLSLIPTVAGSRRWKEREKEKEKEKTPNLIIIPAGRKSRYPELSISRPRRPTN